jgi:hypothetical protein
MFRIVVIARGKGIKATRKTIYRGFEPHIIVIGEKYIEAAIQKRSCKLMKVSRDKSTADQLGLRTLWEC